MDLCSDRQKRLGAGPTGTPQDAIARDESAKETRLPVLVRGCCKLQGGGGRRSAGRRVLQTAGRRERRPRRRKLAKAGRVCHFLSVARIRGGPFCCSHKRY